MIALTVLGLGIFVFFILCWEFIKFIAIPFLILLGIGLLIGFLK